MTDSAARERRLSDIDSALAGLDAGTHRHSLRLRAGIETLRERLHQAHSRCEHVDDRRWSDYRAGLDAGVGELAVELGRVTEHHDVEDVEDLVYPHLARLELEAWRLRVGDAEESLAVDLLAYAHRELTVEGQVRRQDVERILDTLRESVPHTEGTPAGR